VRTDDGPRLVMIDGMAQTLEGEGRRLFTTRFEDFTYDISGLIDARFREGTREVGFSQRFPITDRLSRARDLALTEVRAAEAEVRESERQLIARARPLVVELLAIHRRRALFRGQTDMVESFAAELAVAARRGEISALDAGQAKLETATVALERRRLDATEATALGKLRPLLGMGPEAALHVSGELGPPAEPPPFRGPKARPDHRLAALEARAAGQKVALEKARRLEDLEAGIFAGGERSEDAPEGFENEAIVGFRLKIPLPLWDKNEGNIEAAQARARRKRLETDALAAGIRHEIRAAREEMRRWSELVAELDDSLLPLADAEVARAAQAYDDGQGDLQSVFRAREKQFQLAHARLDALREYHLARARFNAANGRP